jgi:hypothetical protein
VCEAEESPLSEAIAREWLMKTQQTGKRLSGCYGELWRVAVALQLLAVLSCLYEWSASSFTYPNPVNGYTPPICDNIYHIAWSISHPRI